MGIIQVMTAGRAYPRLVADARGSDVASIVAYAKDQLRLDFCREVGDGDRRSAELGDLAVWEGPRIRAVIRILPDRDSEVVHFGPDGTARGDRGPFRHFLTTTRDDPDRHEGFGLTLEDVIARSLENHARWSANWPGGRPVDPRESMGWPDEVIWDDIRVAAVLFARPDGTVRVERFGETERDGQD